MADDSRDTVSTRPDGASGSPGSGADPGSFRDPGSRVFHAGGAVYRAVDERTLEAWQRLAATDFFAEAQGAGWIVPTELVGDAPGDIAPGPRPEHWAGLLRHEPIPVVSYPYEWTFSMLRTAALLQLDLLLGALAEDLILKDSTPYNVQWRGSQPVFIDLGSFEALEPGDVWVGYRQFLRQYLYPLLLRSRVDVPFQPWLQGRPDGLTAEELWRMLPARDRIRWTTLLHVGLQARAERRYRDTERNVRSELQAAGFRKSIIEANVRKLRKVVEELEWDPGASEWSRYAQECGHVSTQRRAKGEFLEAELVAGNPRTVWDVGANDGHFARLAGRTADYVLALDADEVVLDQLFRSLQADGVDNVLPLLQDVSSPSPALGWRGRERTPLIGRSSPDLVICFAVVHHLVIGRNLPLREVVDWLATLDARVVLEFVPHGDPMVERLVANKRPHEIHGDYSEDDLRGYLRDRFVVEREEPVPGGARRMFALRPGA